MIRLTTPTALLALSAMTLSSAPAVNAEEIQLTGVIRDFQTSHPDFEAYPGTAADGMVEAMLGEDGKPVLNMAWWERTVNTSDMSVTSPETFAQWFNDVPGVNIAIPYSITLSNNMDGPGGVYTFARERQMPRPYRYFFPIDTMGFGKSQGPLRWAEVGSHNFHFTYELETSFTYTDPADRGYPMIFSFTGDDDVWVYINGHLAVDIGGVHGQLSESIHVDDAAERLGLEPGGTYQLKLFLAERHTSECNFRIDTTLQLEGAEPTTISPLYD